MPDTLKIFVSGTMTDLKTERDAVARAIASLRLDAVRAETEFSEDRPSRDKILQMARECDIYLGLYNSTRYGWTIPQDGISVTELEFNEAQRLRKPTLIFVKALPKDWASRNDDEKLQRERQKKFIDRVLDFESGKFRAPEFESPAQLETQVAGSLMELLIQHFEVTVTRPPFEVPADLATFVGRAEQIKSLTAALTRDGGTQTYVLFGIGGLGKSALAIHLAHTLRDHFDGGVLWADIPTLRPAEQLAAWGRAYGEEGLSRIKDLDQRALALRPLLQGKRVLAVLDGAIGDGDDARIAPLLKALVDSAVLVTSRAAQLPSLQNAERVDLDKLTLQESADLFERIVGPARVANGRAAVRQIGQVVDFLPLALDLAASQLREHKTWTLDYLCSKLSDAPGRREALKRGDGRLRSIGASCEVSYAALESDEQAFFASLGAFSGEDFDPLAAAAVTSQSEAENALEKLLRLSLVQEGRAAGRYRLHPLLRDWAREPRRKLTTAEQRMATFYCALAREHGSKIHSGAVHAALAVLDLERSNIVAAHEWARKRKDKRGRQLTRDFIYGAMSAYFDLRAQWDDWLAWSQAGLIACQELGDEQGQSAMLTNIANVHASKGEYDAALQEYEDSRSIAERIGDPAGLARTLVGFGNVYTSKGEHAAALQAYDDSRAIFERLRDTAGLATTLTNIGNVYTSKGEYDDALQAYGQSRAFSERMGDTAGLAQTLTNIGLVHANKGEYDAALQAYSDSRTISERIGDTATLAQTIWNIALVYEKQRRLDEAWSLMEQCIEIERRIGLPDVQRDEAYLRDSRARGKPAKKTKPRHSRGKAVKRQSKSRK